MWDLIQIPPRQRCPAAAPRRGAIDLARLQDPVLVHELALQPGIAVGDPGLAAGGAASLGPWGFLRAKSTGQPLTWDKLWDKLWLIGW